MNGTIESKKWPFDPSGKFYNGFSNYELETLCNDKVISQYGPLHNLFWTTEVYSFGKAYRKWLDWSEKLPLPFYGDHGYCALGEMQKHEIDNEASIHVTWNKYRYQCIKDKYNKKILYVPNPWINWRKEKGIQQKKDCRGTLVFYSHSITNVDVIDYDYEKYFAQLRALPDDYKPLVFMFHYNDIKKGNYKFIKEKGYPVITAGNNSSSLFVDRFYDIISFFKFGTSNSGGSELFYCNELGVDYFILGDEPVFFNKGNKHNPQGVMNDRDDLQAALNAKKRELFAYTAENNEKEKKKFVIESLGLDSTIKKDNFKKLLKKELIRLLPFYLKKIVSTYSQAFQKNGFRKSLTKMYNRLASKY